MHRLARSIIGFVFLGLATACATTEPEKYLSRNITDLDAVPKITRVLVKKSERKLFLYSGKDVVRSYDVDLGSRPEGHKTQRGDGRTPEGLYRIDRRNPQSRYFRSLGISYPNAEDRAQARARGVSPGGDIFIHGEARWAAMSGTDWTRGCIAMPDAKMKEIWSLVDVGTPVMITR